jgi:hypothetical protein
MFIPIEPAFLLALKSAPNLYQEALAKNIVLVCPSTLMATLRTVAHLWRQDHQNKNAWKLPVSAARSTINLLASLTIWKSWVNALIKPKPVTTMPLANSKPAKAI